MLSFSSRTHPSLTLSTTARLSHRLGPRPQKKWAILDSNQ
jgi:hypothetical protein